MVSKVTMSQLGLLFASPPSARASAPRTIPRMREAMIWLPKEVAHLGRRERDDACGVDMWHTLKLLRTPARVCVKKCFNPMQCRGCVTNRDLPAVPLAASSGGTFRRYNQQCIYQRICQHIHHAAGCPHRRLNRLIVNRQSPQKQTERKQRRNMRGSLLRFCRQLIFRKPGLDMLELHR